MNRQDRREIVDDLFGLIGQGKQKDGLEYFAVDCRQHNPYVHGGMDSLFESMAAAQKAAPRYPDPYLTIRSILADGDMIATIQNF
jgi:predicted SnoaL-like aldol condensation-catalyzing enzyme